jgi:hypothetical protein
MKPEKPEAMLTPIIPPFRRKPVKSSGVTITTTLIDAVCNALAVGTSPTDAYILAGIAPQTAKKWVSRGRQYIDDGDLTHPMAQFALGTDQALAHYRKFLVEAGNSAAYDRNINVGYVKWRLATSQPHEFGKASIDAQQTGTFQTVTPQEALASLREKIDRLLAPTPTPPVEVPPEPSQSPSEVNLKVVPNE